MSKNKNNINIEKTLKASLPYGSNYSEKLNKNDVDNISKTVIENDSIKELIVSLSLK
ncbi:hypothetical protein FACS189459_6060 [Bacilli bacterium]|nr:hypothetical protein FACS189459_6060 [Bacilli bacterium]